MRTAVIFVAGPLPPLDAIEARPSGSPGSLSVPGPPSGGATPYEGTRGRTLRERLKSRISAVGPDFAVAADGGLDLALSLGHDPTDVIGDMDSVSESAIQAARLAGSTISALPRAKDASDYELALDLAVQRGADRLLVVGGASGRLDHLFATVLTLTSPKYADLLLEAWLADNYVAVINGHGPDTPAAGTSEPTSARAVIHGSADDPVSLFAFNGPAQGIATEGLKWPLRHESLGEGTSRGVSNELLGGTARIEIQNGCLAVIKSQ